MRMAMAAPSVAAGAGTNWTGQKEDAGAAAYRDAARRVSLSEKIEKEKMEMERDRKFQEGLRQIDDTWALLTNSVTFLETCITGIAAAYRLS